MTNWTLLDLFGTSRLSSAFCNLFWGSNLSLTDTLLNHNPKIRFCSMRSLELAWRHKVLDNYFGFLEKARYRVARLNCHWQLTWPHSRRALIIKVYQSWYTDARLAGKSGGMHEQIMSILPQSNSYIWSQRSKVDDESARVKPGAALSTGLKGYTLPMASI